MCDLGLFPKVMCVSSKRTDLALKAPIRTAAADKFCDIFPNFRQKKIRYDILFTKSRGYSNIIDNSIYQTHVINLKQLVLISQNTNKIFSD